MRAPRLSRKGLITARAVWKLSLPKSLPGLAGKTIEVNVDAKADEFHARSVPEQGFDELQTTNTELKAEQGFDEFKRTTSKRSCEEGMFECGASLCRTEDARMYMLELGWCYLVRKPLLSSSMLCVSCEEGMFETTLPYALKLLGVLALISPTTDVCNSLIHEAHGENESKT